MIGSSSFGLGRIVKWNVKNVNVISNRRSQSGEKKSGGHKRATRQVVNIFVGIDHLDESVQARERVCEKQVWLATSCYRASCSTAFDSDMAYLEFFPYIYLPRFGMRRIIDRNLSEIARVVYFRAAGYLKLENQSNETTPRRDRLWRSGKTRRKRKKTTKDEGGG